MSEELRKLADKEAQRWEAQGARQLSDDQLAEMVANAVREELEGRRSKKSA